MLWLAYEVTEDEKYRKAAERHLQSYQDRLDKRIIVDHHDLGFLYSLSSVSAYKLTGSEPAKRMALQASDLLVARFHKKAGIIQAWGDLQDPNQRGRMIIDCNMNLALLYWASDVTGDETYRRIAYRHAQQAATYLVRENASTFHTFYINPDNGEPVGGKTAQGYSDQSCWARGQAWGIYGFALSYAYTKDPTFIELTKKVTNYFLNRLPEDHVCYWDLAFTDGMEERDSSSAAIAACGLLETVKYLPLSDAYRPFYQQAAINIITSLSTSFTTKDEKESNGILMHAVYSKPDGVGVDECCIWGDYFYFEALVRLIKDWQMYW
jgi:unsaturated chondroitin disaccharide hydrolase